MPGTRTGYPHSNPSSSSADSAAGLIHLVGIKTSDTTRASTTTEAQDTDLTVTLLTNHKYRIEVSFVGVDLTVASAGGVKLSLAGTATADNVQIQYSVVGDTAPVEQGVIASITSITSQAYLSSVQIHLVGSLRCTAGGTLFIKWAQFSSLVTGFKLQAGSYIDAMDLGI